MKLVKIIAAAGLGIAAIAGATSANAEGWDRHDHRYVRHYVRHYEHRYYHHRHCWTEWHRHHRVTICR